MKQVIISIMTVVFVGSGFSQNQLIPDKKNSATQAGPNIEQVEIERDILGDRRRSKEKKKKDSIIPQSEKTAVVKSMEKTNSHSKIFSADNAKPNQIINKKGILHFGQGKEQIFTRIKRIKKIGRVEGIAPREEIKKIVGHAPVSENVLIQALDNPRSVQKHVNKNK